MQVELKKLGKAIKGSIVESPERSSVPKVDRLRSRDGSGDGSGDGAS